PGSRPPPRAARSGRRRRGAPRPRTRRGARTSGARPLARSSKCRPGVVSSPWSQGTGPGAEVPAPMRLWYSRRVKFPRQVPGIPRSSEWHELSEDVVYAEVDGVPLRYDHYRPRKVDGLAPCVVFVHGGAWTGGDPSQAAGNGLHFARRGIATVSISYRLAPAHRFPAPLDDVRHGLRHVRAHASELGIDPDRLVLMGLSAGAHLAMLAHLARNVPALRPDLPGALA